MARTIEIQQQVTVGTLAEKLMIPVTTLIAELMKNGIMATVNERIDLDTAQIIVEELGLDIDLRSQDAEEEAPVREKRKQSAKGAARPPVVAMMGHVDHGKTSLLDAIRGSKVVKGEAGGITQHIAAYQITHNKRLITFLDTPGHEAFAALRQHGANATDLVVIVVAADDGIKPQTVEAIRYARKAGVKILVAINKIDKEGANPNQIKQQLADHDILVEGWGGDTVVVEVSAKTGQNLDSLLDMILLVSDVEELKAVDSGPASGIIIEAHMEKGRGSVAVGLVEEGSLANGDFVVAGTTYAKVRNLESTEGNPLKKAGPSTPVIMTGFKSLPEFGNEFFSVASEKEARTKTQEAVRKGAAAGGRLDMNSNELIRIINRKNELQELPVIVKADVQGSLTSVIDSLKSLEHEEVAVRVVGSGVGAISESDVHTAHTTSAIIIGFHVDFPANVKQLASRDSVPVHLYKVIYELLDDVKEELSKLLAPEVVEKDLGTLIVKGVFKTTKSEIICGGEVSKGKLTVPAFARIRRGDDKLAEVEVTNLKRGPQDAKEVLEGEMCGVNLKTATKLQIEEGDRLEFFTRETVTRTL